MSSKEILEQALRLSPGERVLVLEGLLTSFDEPDPSIDTVWAEEAQKRLDAYRTGKLAVIPLEEVFKDA